MSIVPLSPWLAHRPRRGATVVDTVVLHADEHEDIEELVRELRHKDASYHYIIDRNGAVLKCVPFSAVAFHCSNSYGPHEASRGVSYERDAHGGFIQHSCINDYTLGICLLNNGAESYPKEQIEACQFLVRDLKTPLPKLRYVTSHACVAPGRAVDPSGFDFAHLAKFAELEIWVPEAALA